MKQLLLGLVVLGAWIAWYAVALAIEDTLGWLSVIMFIVPFILLFIGTGGSGWFYHRH